MCQTSGQFCVILSQGTLSKEGNKRAGDFFVCVPFFFPSKRGLLVVSGIRD